MWVQVGNEYLNLNHVSRVRFSDAWKHSAKYLVAEIETLHQGETRLFTRVRGQDAETLREALHRCSCTQERIFRPSHESLGAAPTLAEI